MKKEFNYKSNISKDGGFSPHINDRKLVKQLDAYCLITNTNKTKYVVDALREKLMYDLENIKTNIKKDEDEEYE